MKNEVVLKFCVWEYDDITPDEITDLVGYDPVNVFVKGEQKSSRSPVLWQYNGWIMDSLSGKYSSFEEQMNFFLDTIESKKDIFRILCTKYSCEFSCVLFIYLDNGESKPSVHLDKRYNALIMDGINIEFDLDLYCMPNVDEENDL